MSAEGSEPPGAARGDPPRAVPSFPPGTNNRRPELVASLLCERDVGPAWFAHADRQNRFFVVNLDTVLGLVGFGGHSTAGTYCDEAERIIAAETKWRDQYAFQYVCHQRHLARDRRVKPKYFGHAATMIVALEVMAKAQNRPVNVYDFLRILPAQYFIDRFDKKRKAQLAENYNSISADEKRDRFGPDKVGLAFDELCLVSIEQPTSAELLDQMTSGYCVTKYTANLLMNFINDKFDKDLKIGPIIVSGGECNTPGLGDKSAAPALRVPRTLEDIPPCP